MACAGLKAVESTLQTIKFKNSTQRIINLALDMMNFTKKFSFGNSKKIIIKIGIHFGPVIAGVIGYHKPQFSLIGDTVNTTSRVCSTGEESTINISQVAYQRIKNIFNNLNFIEKVVEAKGKGQIITYQIIKKKKLAITNRKSRYLIKMDEEEKVSAIKMSTQENQEFLNVSKKIRKNIKNNTILTINNMISQSPRHTASNISNPINFSHSIYANSFRKNSPFENNNSDSLKSLSNIVNEAPLLLKNKIKTDASFHKMNSDLKGNLIDELSYSDKKVSSAYNLSQNDMNFFQYIETEHLKALQKGIQLNIDKIEKTEHFPGEFLSQKKIDVTIKEENKPSQININEDEFFDKLKINENSLEILNFNKFWLSKKNNDPMILEDFLENRKHASFKENVINIFTFSLVYLSNTFLMILKKDYLANFEILLTFRLIISILVFIFFLLFRKKSSHIVFMRRILLILNFLIINELFLEFVLGNYYGIENTLELTLFYLIFINYSYLTFVDNFILLIYIALLLLLQLINNFNLEFILNMILVFFSLILILNNLRMKILSAYQNFNTLRVNKIKKNQQNDLIFNLLPSHILEKFLRNPNQKLNLTDEFEDVTILFADIAGFTKYSSSVSAIQVVALLKDLFTEFDKLCLDNCVYKLYTIGDCYVVLGLIDAEDRNVEGEALNVINFGFQMLEKIKEVKKRVSFHDIDMRIGIHTVLFFTNFFISNYFFGLIFLGENYWRYYRN